MLPTILVFLKSPEPGKVKTRLAATIGAQRAADLYCGWIGEVFGRLQPLRERMRVVGFVEGGPLSAFREWTQLADDWWPQPEGDLGHRLQDGFRRAHAGGGAVVAVGTDCLELDAEVVMRAVAELRGHDAVFGPAADGGYYLVGTARALPGFFAGIRWSSEHTLADHLARCCDRCWSAGLLSPRHDIDTWDDWQAYLTRQEVADDCKRGE